MGHQQTMACTLLSLPNKHIMDYYLVEKVACSSFKPSSMHVQQPAFSYIAEMVCSC